VKQRAAAYIRVSTADQTEFSPDAQLKQIRDYAKRNNMVLLDEHIYADEGISGRSTSKRIAFNNMIKNAKRKPKPFDVILIHKFNRFARNREDAIIYKSLLKRDCGIRVISITEPIEDGKIGIIIESVLDALAEYYSINLAEEVKKGMSEKASRGGVQTRPPFGYDIDENKFAINNVEAEIVKIIFTKFLDTNMTYLHIAKYLNDLGIKTKNGNRFQSKSIKYILSNPVYISYLRWNRKYKNGSYRDLTEWIISKGEFEPIVTDEEFEKAQKKIDLLTKIRGKNASPEGAYKHFLSGLLVCKSCGGKMVFTRSKDYTYFRCRKAKEGGCDMRASVRTHILEKAVLEQIEHDFNHIDLIVSDVEIIADNSDLEFYKQQLKSVDRKFSQAKEAYLGGIDTLEEYKESKSLFQKEKETLLNHISEATKDKLQSKKNSIKQKLGLITEIVNDNISLSQKNQVLKSFIKEIVVDIPNDSFEIEYYILDDE
jgi:DNA invertase Pin-like site-specific DNA recombinase